MPVLLDSHEILVVLYILDNILVSPLADPETAARQFLLLLLGEELVLLLVQCWLLEGRPFLSATTH
jgi:hypothetical protein